MLLFVAKVKSWYADMKIYLEIQKSVGTKIKMVHQNIYYNLVAVTMVAYKSDKRIHIYLV